MATNVTNQDILDALKALNFDQVLPDDPTQLLKGAQNSEFKGKLTTLGIDDKTFEQAKTIARIGPVKDLRGAVKYMQALGLDDAAIQKYVQSAGASRFQIPADHPGGMDLSTLLDDQSNREGDISKVVGALNTDRPGMGAYLGGKSGRPAAPVAAAPAPAAPAAPVTLSAPGAPKGTTVVPKVTPNAAAGAGKADLGTGTLADGRLDPKANASQVQAYVQKNFGHYAYLFNNPEIQPLIQEAASKGYDENWLVGKVTQTSYWQHTDAKSRAWDAAKVTDPADAQRQVNEEVADMKQWGMRYGLNLGDDRWKQLAETSIRLGWDPTQKHQALSAEIHYSPGPGQVDPEVVSQLKAKAGNYYVPMSDGALNEWSQHVAAADGDTSGFDGYLVQQAKSLFPSLSGALDRGVSVKTFADPYGQIASKMLGIPQDQIDFSDPKWMKALVNPDPKTGDRTFMGMADWQDELKKNPVYGWDKTQNARDEAAQLSQQIIHRFGGGV